MNRDVNKYWNNQAKKLEGKTIKKARYMSEKEAEGLGWYARSVVLECTDGTLLFPSTDDEGNNAGALFGQTPKGESLDFPVI